MRDQPPTATRQTPTPPSSHLPAFSTCLLAPSVLLYLSPLASDLLLLFLGNDQLRWVWPSRVAQLEAERQSQQDVGPPSRPLVSDFSPLKGLFKEALHCLVFSGLAQLSVLSNSSFAIILQSTHAQARSLPDFVSAIQTPHMVVLHHLLTVICWPQPERSLISSQPPRLISAPFHHPFNLAPCRLNITSAPLFVSCFNLISSLFAILSTRQLRSDLSPAISATHPPGGSPRNWPVQCLETAQLRIESVPILDAVV